MSDSVINNSNRQKIQQLLAAVGLESEEDTKYNIDAYDYNWRQPHCFDNNQLKKLNNFMEKVARNCARKFTQLYHSDFSVSVSSTTQHFADELTASGNALNDYYLTFGADRDQPSGFVGIPGRTAIIWATQLLGDTKSAEDTERDLSQLEKSLLADTAAGIVEALSDSSNRYDFQPAVEIVSGQLPIAFKGPQELCKITLSVRKSDSKDHSEAYYLMLCDELLSVVDDDIRGQALSAENISRAMLNHVYEVPVCVKALLDSTVLAFGEIMSLGVGDILLLDKKTDEPVELMVEDRVLFRGQPAKSGGKYAVVITETAYNTR